MSAEEITAESRKSGTINFKPEPLGNPVRLSADANVSNTVTLENNQLKLVFYQLVEGKQGQVESEVFVDGMRVKSRSELDALVLLQATESQLYYDKGFPIFRSKILDQEGNVTVALGKSPYESYQTEDRKSTRLNTSH